MGKTVTFNGRIRSRGGARQRDKGSPGVGVHSVMFSFDPTQVSATDVRVGGSAVSGERLVLPKGTILIESRVIVNAAGTSLVTVDLGLTDEAGTNSPQSLIDEYLVGSGAAGAGIKALAPIALSFSGGQGTDQAYRVTARAGAVAPSAGTCTCLLVYTFFDDGKVDSLI